VTPDPDRDDESPVLPERSSDECDLGWGERPEPDDDERLRRDRPPHWDSP
jgi:hypothetical protein